MSPQSVMSIASFIVPLLFSLSLVSGLKECKSIDACKCSTDEGTIDLWSLAGTGTQPRFKDIPDKSPIPGAKVTFSWNPCKEWSLETSATGSKNYCKNVAVCTTIRPDATLGNSVHYDTGEQDTASFVLNSTTGNCYLEYTGYYFQAHQDKSFTYITLVCNEDKEGSLEDMHWSPTENTVRGRLVSKYACPIKTGLSTGSILLIIFFCLLIVYIVAGLSYNKFAQGSSGKELIPNYSFWVDFPVLIKDGVVFFCKSCRRLCNRNTDGYNAM